MLLLHEFDFIIQHCPGTQHAIADFLRRVDNGETTSKDDDGFPDADVVLVAMIASREEKNFPDQWQMDMTYFLTAGMPPPQLRADEKKRLAVCSHNFCLIEGILYNKGSDGRVHQDEKEAVLHEAHYGTTGWHYAGDVTARKIWQAGLWWPTM